MKKKAKDILIRTLKTFVQAFIGYFTADIFIGITDITTLKKVVLSALIGAFAAGICAVWNMLIAWLDTYFEGRESQNIAETRTETTEVEYEDYDSEREENE